MLFGRVKFFNEKKGYGFITPNKDAQMKNDVFVHASGIKGDRGFKTLKEGDTVEFEVKQGLKGMQAVDVVKV